MLKKALIGLAVVAASSAAALANGGSFAPAPARNCVGAFYVGAAVSRDVVGFDTDVNNYQTNYSTVDGYAADGLYTSSVYNDNANFDWNADGVDGQLFAGYGMVFQDHYTLAAEVFGSISSAKGDFDTNGTSTYYNYPENSVNATGNYNNTASAELDHTIGIALLPGFKMSDSTTLYARVGYVYSEFKLDDNGSNCYAGTCTSSAALGYTPIDSDKNEGGLQLGLGAQTMVTSNVGVRLEYTWERYSDVNFTTASTGSSVDAGGNSYVSNSYATNYKLNNPTVDTVNFGVFYAFNS